MARAPAKAKATEPLKLDPTARTPTPADVMVRGRASRPTFRRGGLVFGDRDWTPIDPDAMQPADALAVLAEPVITIQGREAGGEWRPMPADIREGLIEVLQEKLADDAKDAAASKADA